jgi:hypothetical protein
MGTFNLRPIKIKYMEHSQRFYSMLEIDLASQDGEALKLVYSIFVERDPYRL